MLLLIMDMEAKYSSIPGSMVLLEEQFSWKGTVKNRILELLDLREIRKEIVLMFAEKVFIRSGRFK